MHSLSTTTSVESSGLRQHNLRESPFILGVLANLSGFRTMPESVGPGVVHFYFLYFCGQHFYWHYNFFLSFSFLHPYLLQVDPHGEGGPYGLGCSPTLRSL